MSSSTEDVTNGLIVHQHYANQCGRWIARTFLTQSGHDHLPDIDQEAQIALWHAITTYDPTKSHITTWIQHCVTYRIQDYIQHQTIVPDESLEQHLQTHGDLADSQSSLEQQMVQWWLRDAITQLTWLQRQIIEHRFSDNGCSRRACAQRLGTSTETIKQQEAYALTRLRYSLRYYREPSTRKDQ